MNDTENYHLPQWEETDRIMRTDFNQMCADIESGIVEAKKKADEAYSTDYPPLVIGTYAGGGETETPVDVGFRPRFVLITGQVAGYEDTQVRCILAAGPGLMTSALRFHDEGFSIRTISKLNSGTRDYPHMNDLGKTYTYIAFR